MSVIEAGGRGGAIALLLLLVVLLLRDGRNVLAGRYAALYALGSAAAMVTGTPALVTDETVWLHPLRALTFGNPAILWLLAAALFDDTFAPSWRHAAAWAGLVALGFLGLYGSGSRPFLPFNGLRLLCVLLALWHGLAGRAADLVEARRRLRIVFVVVVALFNAGITIAVVALHGGANFAPLGFTDAFGSLALTFGFAIVLLSLDRDGLLLTLAAPGAGQSMAAVPPPNAASITEPDSERETVLLAALNRLMDVDRAYREEGLSIAVLAARLDIPEYRLRRLINQRLGHRNFSAFLNGYRLAEVMAALSDASQAEVPILTIALDAGFQSVGPFNRAFKSETGMTPSEFRRAHHAGTA